MTPFEMQTQAAKYRAMAFGLSPHLATIKQQYLSRAADFERQAHELLNPETPAIEIEPESPRIATVPAVASTTPASQPAIIIANQTKIHSNLALAVLSDKRAGIHRAFTIWLALRQQDKAHFSKTEIIEFFSEQTGNHPRNVRRWLDAGQDIFWTYGRKNRVSILGRDKVFSSYNLVSPGRVLNVDSEPLFEKLQTLRAALFATFTGGKDSKWIARSTLKELTSIEERTQLNYDNLNEQQKQSTYALGFQLETSNSDAKQMPNRYYSRWYPAYSSDGKTTGKRYGLYTPEINRVTSTQDNVLSPAHSVDSNRTGVTTGGNRLLFDNPNHAVKAAHRRNKAGRQGQLFAVFPGPATKNGHLLLKTIDYANS